MSIFIRILAEHLELRKKKEVFITPWMNEIVKALVLHSRSLDIVSKNDKPTLLIFTIKWCL